MRAAYAVIGAHYGDEGKGQVTAWICRRLHEIYPDAKVLNVLTNGGCQRGHTVNIPERKFRHVFKHFGSGTPYGAHTHFGPEFVVNPMQFVKELDELEALGLKPVVSCGWHNRIQLPVDMAVNQYLERRRSVKGTEHGSVGFGVNETLLRYERGMGSTFLKMASDADSNDISFVDGITALSHDYAYDRVIEETGEESAFKEFESEYCDYISEDCHRHYADDLLRMSRRVNEGWDASRSYDHDFFVFENGQGLKIGQQTAVNFYHCTPSDTGAFSVLRAMSDMKLIGCNADDRTKVDRVVPVYVTRTYMTRHGAGPFAVQETSEPPFGEKPDETNVPNDFQGSIRYAKLSGRWEFNAVLDDMFRFRSTCVPQCDVKPMLAVTHAVDRSMELMASFLPWDPNVTFSADQPEEFEMDSDFFQPNNNKPPCIR